MPKNLNAENESIMLLVNPYTHSNESSKIAVGPLTDISVAGAVSHACELVPHFGSNVASAMPDPWMYQVTWWWERIVSR